METKIRFQINMIFCVVIGGLFYISCQYLLPAMFPFLIAFSLAALVQVPARRFSGKGEGKRKLLAFGLCALCYVLLAAAALFAGAKGIQAAVKAAASVPELYVNQIMPALSELSDILEQKTASLDVGMAEVVKTAFDCFTQNAGQYVSDLSIKTVKWLSGGVAGIPELVINFVVTVIATFFMAIDFPAIMAFLRHIIPQKQQGYVRQLVDYIRKVLLIYLRSYMLLFLLTFTELSLGLMLFRIPCAVLVALGISLFDILPVLGTGGILLPWAVILFILGKVPLGIGIVVLYLVITVIRNVTEPKLVGKQIGLHPLATLIAMFTGLKLLGIGGMILFPCALAILVGMRSRKGTDGVSAAAWIGIKPEN